MLYPSSESASLSNSECHDGTPWLEEQAAYQAETFGVNYAAMASDPEELTRYVTMNLNAAFLELAEAQQETPWKPWATVDKGRVWAENRDRFVGELVDVLFFVANALCAVDCADEELAKRYAQKMGVNRRRQADGYDGMSAKCPRCNRALDEPGALPIAGTDGTAYCSTLCAALSESGTAANPNRVRVDTVIDLTRCAKCGYQWGPLELFSTGLDGKRYCGTEHAIDASGGQLDPEDYGA
jgi:hypothetical protein